MPCSFAAAIESESLIEPPGCMMEETPISLAASMPSRNGKNASDTIIESFALSPALLAAILTASTRLVWPGPTPTVAKPDVVLDTSSIAFDLTSEMTVVPNFASMIYVSVNSLSVTHCTESHCMDGGPWTCANQPPSSCRKLTTSSRGAIDESVSILLFFF